MGEPNSRRSLWLLLRLSILILVAALSALALVYVTFLGAWQRSEATPRTYAVALGDLDGDGDLDAFYANGLPEGPQANAVLLNQGGLQAGEAGVFADSGQRLGRDRGRAVHLADLDADGDLDALVSGMPLLNFYENIGAAEFVERSPLSAELSGMWSVALGDLDADGDLDILAGACCGPHEAYNAILWNQGGLQGGAPGRFSRAQADYPGRGAEGVALGDLDGDGDPDAFFGNNLLPPQTAEGEHSLQPNQVWWNDGAGNFVDSGQRLGRTATKAVALGDLDGDGKPDAYVANAGPDEVWLNDSPPGSFIDSGQRLGNRNTIQVALADLDGDHDLDAAATELGRFFARPGLRIWRNDGFAGFSSKPIRLSYSQAQTYALGDLDGDGDLDVLAAWYPDGYVIWWNQGKGQFVRAEGG